MKTELQLSPVSSLSSSKTFSFPPDRPTTIELDGYSDDTPLPAPNNAIFPSVALAIDQANIDFTGSSFTLRSYDEFSTNVRVNGRLLRDRVHTIQDNDLLEFGLYRSLEGHFKVDCAARVSISWLPSKVPTTTNWAGVQELVNGIRRAGVLDSEHQPASSIGPTDLSATCPGLNDAAHCPAPRPSVTSVPTPVLASSKSSTPISPVPSATPLNAPALACKARPDVISLVTNDKSVPDQSPISDNAAMLTCRPAKERVHIQPHTALDPTSSITVAPSVTQPHAPESSFTPRPDVVLPHPTRPSSIPLPAVSTTSDACSFPAGENSESYCDDREQVLRAVFVADRSGAALVPDAQAVASSLGSSDAGGVQSSATTSEGTTSGQDIRSLPLPALVSTSSSVRQVMDQESANHAPQLLPVEDEVLAVDTGTETIRSNMNTNTAYITPPNVTSVPTSVPTSGLGEPTDQVSGTADGCDRSFVTVSSVNSALIAVQRMRSAWMMAQRDAQNMRQTRLVDIALSRLRAAFERLNDKSTSLPSATSCPSIPQYLPSSFASFPSPTVLESPIHAPDVQIAAPAAGWHRAYNQQQTPLMPHAPSSSPHRELLALIALALTHFHRCIDFVTSLWSSASLKAPILHHAHSHPYRLCPYVPALSPIHFH